MHIYNKQTFAGVDNPACSSPNEIVHSYVFEAGNRREGQTLKGKWHLALKTYLFHFIIARLNGFYNVSKKTFNRATEMHSFFSVAHFDIG